MINCARRDYYTSCSPLYLAIFLTVSISFIVGFVSLYLEIMQVKKYPQATLENYSTILL